MNYHFENIGGDLAIVDSNGTEQGRAFWGPFALNNGDSVLLGTLLPEPKAPNSSVNTDDLVKAQMMAMHSVEDLIKLKSAGLL